MRTLSDTIVESCEASLANLNSDGSMPAGHNGPYHDPETPVRNTSHWLIAFLKAYESTNEERFREAAESILEFLYSSAARPQDETFHHRTNPNKDGCNGLIGQAWTIEALAVANRVLDEKKAADIAREVFLLHPFDETLALWNRVEIDGSILSFDRTFNHQLWFAASGGLLADSAEAPVVDQRVRRFVDMLAVHLDIYESGLIRHPLRPSYPIGRYVRSIFNSRRRAIVPNLLFHILRPPESKKQLHSKAIGYHSFNLYAFALLKRVYPDHDLWKNDRLTKAVQYIRSDEYTRSIDDNKYGYSYNPPGFENAFVLSVFEPESESEQRRWVTSQLSRCFDFDARLMTEETKDPMTHSARLYEATRLPNYSLPLDEQNRT